MGPGRCALTVQCSEVNAVKWCSIAQWSAVQWWGAALFEVRKILYSIVLYSTYLYSTVQYSFVQYNCKFSPKLTSEVAITQPSYLTRPAPHPSNPALMERWGIVLYPVSTNIWLNWTFGRVHVKSLRKKVNVKKWKCYAKIWNKTRQLDIGAHFWPHFFRVLGPFWTYWVWAMNLFIHFKNFICYFKLYIYVTHDPHFIIYFLCWQKVDGVGPVDNRPSTD